MKDFFPPEGIFLLIWAGMFAWAVTGVPNGRYALAVVAGVALGLFLAYALWMYVREVKDRRWYRVSRR